MDQEPPNSLTPSVRLRWLKMSAVLEGGPHLLPFAVADVLLSHHYAGVTKLVHYLPDVTG